MANPRETSPEKYYLALKCLVAAFKLDPSDPTAHEQAIRFRHTRKFPSIPLSPISTTATRTNKPTQSTVSTSPSDPALTTLIDTSLPPPQTPTQANPSPP